MKKKAKKLRPLVINAKCVSDNKTLLKNIKSAMKHRLPVLWPAPVHHDGHMVMVGAGPTALNFLDSIRNQRKAGRPIVAIKGAHDWLMENDIVPDMCVMVDPQENQTRYLQKKHEKTIYLVASQCHPKIFSHLKGNKVLLWHAHSKIGEDKIVGKGQMLVSGGTTSGLRAINIGHVMGYSRFEFYGYDSCGNTGVSGHVATEKMIEVHVNGEVFMTTPAMAKQAEEFQHMFNMIPGLSARLFGDGLIKAVMEERQKKINKKIKESEAKA